MRQSTGNEEVGMDFCKMGSAMQQYSFQVRADKLLQWPRIPIINRSTFTIRLKGRC